MNFQNRRRLIPSRHVDDDGDDDDKYRYPIGPYVLCNGHEVEHHYYYCFDFQLYHSRLFQLESFLVHCRDEFVNSLLKLVDHQYSYNENN